MINSPKQPTAPNIKLNLPILLIVFNNSCFSNPERCGNNTTPKALGTSRSNSETFTETE
ncbi:hypothetical protein D3C86_2108100 [compost metagenome]